MDWCFFQTVLITFVVNFLSFSYFSHFRCLTRQLRLTRTKTCTMFSSMGCCGISGKTGSHPRTTLLLQSDKIICSADWVAVPRLVKKNKSTRSFCAILPNPLALNRFKIIVEVDWVLLTDWFEKTEAKFVLNMGVYFVNRLLNENPVDFSYPKAMVGVFLWPGYVGGGGGRWPAINSGPTHRRIIFLPLYFN